MASWNEPALINKISDDVPAIKNLLIALLKMSDAGTEDVPVDAQRLQEVTGGIQFQKYTGSTWANIGKLMHDVDMLDGKHATSSATADTIPVRDANGKLAGDILGNANTATTASSVAAGYVVPVANGGTGASDEAGARTNLGTNNAANITTGVLAIANGGTGSNTKNFVDLSSAQNIGGNKTFSGAVSLDRSTLRMIVLDTTEGATTTRSDVLIQGISSNTDYGITSLFGTSGNTILGAGEGKGSLLAELAGNTGENVYIIADGNIYFYPNANTYANKKTVTLNSSAELSGLAKVTATTFAGNLSGNVTGNVTGNCSGSSGSCTGNAANVTGTVAIAHGGTGATTRLAALKALTNENVGTSAQHFLVITDSWGKGGYCNVANAKTVLGLKSAAYTESSAYAAASHTHSYVAKSGDTMTGALSLKTNSGNAIRFYDTGATKGTAPSSNRTHYIEFFDKDGKRMGWFGSIYYTNKGTRINLSARKSNAAGDTAEAGIGVHVDANGTAYGFAPTPAAGDNTTTIATTAWVRARLGNGEKGMVPSGVWAERKNNTEYTAGTNGWVYGRNSKYNSCGKSSCLHVNGVDFWMQLHAYGSGSCNLDAVVIVPVKKGQKYKPVALDSCGWIAAE